MDEINQTQSDELTGVSEGVSIQPSTATPTTIAHIIDPKTTLADSLDKTKFGQKNIRFVKAASDFAFTVARGMDLLATVADCSDIPHREPTSNHIDPAKEIGIGAARTRSEAYLAKKEDTKSRDHEVDSVLDANVLSIYSVNATTAAGSSNRSSKNDVQGRFSPAQSDEIETARIRMEA
ncbi:unnamed protein product [Caenorhabditis brenneri]